VSSVSRDTDWQSAWPWTCDKPDDHYGRGGVAAAATVLASMLAIGRRAKALGLTIPESFLLRAD
jgi:hypothetical protein